MPPHEDPPYRRDYILPRTRDYMPPKALEWLRKSSACGGTESVLTANMSCQYNHCMAKSTRKKPATRRAKRVSRTYRLPLAKLSAAKRALGTTTSTEAIEKALDLAVFQRDLIAGTRAMFGIRIESPDPEE